MPMAKLQWCHKETKLAAVMVSVCLLVLSSLALAKDTPDSDDTANQKEDSLLQRIVDSYISSSNTDKTLKHLLDAKMYLSTAEHDLLVSHDKKSAHEDIESTLQFLAEAVDVAKPDIKTRVIALIETLKVLEQRTDNKAQAGKDNEVDDLLGVAQKNLLKASDIASPEEKQEIAKINNSIQRLRNKIEHVNLRDDYEKSMQTLNEIINAL